ncbi:hypothetical protein D9615_005895 [Tricholomella constricta]|uniref:DUF6535 domain-containing protein n=1 Tax=Tricholomella constricta TaxID=117010 RepID=A0A8H5H9C7_9AGAR|nr:hypothetical protein D9615_005895 [Tricholomella constricta]
MASNNAPHEKDLADDPRPEVLGNSAKIWKEYISDATKEDQGLAQNYKGDMDSILIFAGLFSSCLTTFVIESYKSLQPDPGDTTVQLLAQISQQLANGSQSAFSEPAPFIPPTSAVICNLLWFLSLGFSLASALAATLVQQWARNYVQMAESQPRTADRARVRAYLYRGLQRFKMRTVVDAIPMLLHISLFLFFAGLVHFLFPVNLLIGYLSLTIFAISFILYMGCTFLPLVYTDCPYHTPASTWCWNGVKLLRGYGYLQSLGSMESIMLPTNMQGAAHVVATSKSTQRDALDRETVQSTIQALDTRGNLLSFIMGHFASKTASEADKRHIVMLLDSTDLTTRLCRILDDAKFILVHDDRLRCSNACFVSLDKLATLWSHLAPSRRQKRIYIGVEQLAVVFGVLRNSVHAEIGVTPDNYKNWEVYSFKLLWCLLSTFLDDAAKLHTHLSTLVTHDEFGGLAEGTVSEPLANDELRAIITDLSKELATGCDLLSSGHLDMVALLPIPGTANHPLLQRMKNVWYAFLALLGQLDNFSDNGATGLPPLFHGLGVSKIKDIIEEFQDLIISIHFLRLSLLFHRRCNDAPSDRRVYAEAERDLESNAKLISRFTLPPASQQRVASALLLLCEERILRRTNQERSVKNRTKKSMDLELSTTRLLLSVIQEKAIIESVDRGLYAQLLPFDAEVEVAPEPAKPGRIDQRNSIRNQLVKVAEALTEKAGITTSIPDVIMKATSRTLQEQTSDS